jgi:hypothetical protein
MGRSRLGISKSVSASTNILAARTLATDETAVRNERRIVGEPKNADKSRGIALRNR